MSAAFSLGGPETKGLQETPRLRYIVVPPQAQPDFRTAVLEGLSRDQKSIPSRFLYDEVGSALFEAITCLHEYYLTRKERAILAANAAEIVRSVGRRVELVEFGSGSAEKTRLLLGAALRTQKSLRFVPIDISQAALQGSAVSLLNEHPQLEIVAIAAEYRDALKTLPESRDPRLILLLGSNIGNFKPCEAGEFLSGIAAEMRPDDRLLVGADLVKDPGVIELAYNDPAGVTSAFNKNLLSRVNRELGGRFDLDGFVHRAPFIQPAGKVEMRLVSLKDQWVRIEGMNGSLRFRKGEYIHTEDSHKYTVDGFAGLTDAAGLATVERWTDEDSWFALTLLRTK